MRGRRYDDHRLSRMTIGYCQIFTAKFGEMFSRIFALR
jgi:hypothetical protein